MTIELTDDEIYEIHEALAINGTKLFIDRTGFPEEIEERVNRAIKIKALIKKIRATQSKEVSR